MFSILTRFAEDLSLETDKKQFFLDKIREQLDAEEGELPRALSPETAQASDKVSMDEQTFRWELNSDPMATEKLAEGIRKFDADHQALISLVAEKMGA